jgi:predicted acetyltransferase
MYVNKVFEKPEEMCSSYEVAKLLNPRMTEEQYKSAIDRITSNSNYKQYVVLHDDKVVSMIATQDVLVMGNAPRMTCKLDNVATLPEHRGFVTQMLMRQVLDKIKTLDYGGVCLDCNTKNDRGNKFYKKMGFEKDNNGWVLRFDEKQTFTENQSKNTRRKETASTENTRNM